MVAAIGFPDAEAESMRVVSAEGSGARGFESVVVILESEAGTWLLFLPKSCGTTGSFGLTA